MSDSDSSSSSDNESTAASASAASAGGSKGSGPNMSELAKGILLMPVLNSKTLGHKSAIEKFVRTFDSFLVHQANARFAEAVEGSAWAIIAIMCPDLEKDPTKVLNVDFRRELLKLHSSTSQPELLLRKWGKIKMRDTTSSSVDLESCIQYFVEFLAAFQLTSSEERPRSSKTRDVFLKGIRPAGLQRTLREKARKRSVYKDTEGLCALFLSCAKEQVTLQNKVKAFQDAGSDSSTSGKSSAEVKMMVTSMVAAQLGVADAAADGSAAGKSKFAKRRAAAKAVKAALNTKLVKADHVPDAEKVCYGCGYPGHGRNNCPHRGRKGFLKFPEKAKKPISLN